VHGVPDRVHVWNLVGHELDGVERERDADDPPVVQGFEPARQTPDQLVALHEPQHRHRRVQVDARGPRRAERRPEDGDGVHLRGGMSDEG
jgi:hypothetical protein